MSDEFIGLIHVADEILLKPARGPRALCTSFTNLQSTPGHSVASRGSRRGV